MTHVDLIEKLLKYEPRETDAYSRLNLGALLICRNRYTPDGRAEKKAELNERT